MFCSSVEDGDVNSPVIFTNEHVNGIANHGVIEIMEDAPKRYTSLWMYYNPTMHESQQKRLRSFKLSYWEDSQWKDALSPDDSIFNKDDPSSPVYQDHENVQACVTATSALSGSRCWVQFTFPEITSKRFKISEMNGGPAVYSSQIYMFEIKFSHETDSHWEPAYLRTAASTSSPLPAWKSPKVQGWCVRHNKVDFTEDKEKRWQGPWYGADRNGALNLGAFTSELGNIPCGSKLVSELYVSKLDVQQKLSMTQGIRIDGQGKTDGVTDQAMDVLLLNDRGETVTTVPQILASDIGCYNAKQEMLNDLKDPNGDLHASNAGNEYSCQPQESSFGPILSHMEAAQGSNDFTILVMPRASSGTPLSSETPDKPASAKNALGWKLEAGEFMTFTFWWKPPLPSMPCSIDWGKLQYESEDP